MTRSSIKTDVVWMEKRVRLQSHLKTDVVEPGAQLKTEHDKDNHGISDIMTE